MDNEQARFVLGACQPSGSDTSRPEVVEALAQARLDPELGTWLARERRSDAAIADKMRQLEPPTELRARLLAGGRASRPVTAFRRWYLPLSLAAAAVIAVGVAFWPRQEKIIRTADGTPALVSWQRSCVGIFSNPFFSLDKTSDSYPPLEAHLLQCRAPTAGELPFNDAIADALGCKVLEWHGATVSLTCFHSKTGELVHLFVMPRGHVDETPLRRGAHREQVGSYATVTWLRNDLVVMVASKLPAGELDKVLVRNSDVAAIVVKPTIVDA